MLYLILTFLTYDSYLTGAQVDYINPKCGGLNGGTLVTVHGYGKKVLLFYTKYHLKV